MFAEDQSGVDFWVRTIKTGYIGLDQKSSKRQCNRNEKAVNVLSEFWFRAGLTNRQVFERMIETISAHCDRMLGVKEAGT